MMVYLKNGGSALAQESTPDEGGLVEIVTRAGGGAGSRDSRVALISSDGKALWQTTLNYIVRGLSVTSNGATVTRSQTASSCCSPT